MNAMARPGLARARAVLSEADAAEERAALLRREAERLIAAEDDGLDSRDIDRRKVHAAFSAAVRACKDLGWTNTRIAEVMGVSKVTLGDWLDDPTRRRDQLGLWVLSALDRLPREARVAFDRAMAEWRAPVVWRTGTDG